MKKMLLLVVSLLGLALFALTDADAKRLGGGSSLGRQYSAPSQPSRSQGAAPAASAQSKALPPTGARPSGASRWLGPLAGLAAGGLLAALLFGDGFQGVQVLDLLLIAGLVLGAVMLFRAMRRGAPQPAGAGALGGAYPSAAPRSLPLDLGGSMESVEVNEAPPWFDEAGFVDGAKGHFVRLQEAWDRGDLSNIREYTTPDLFDALTSERARLGQATHDTEVVTLEAHLAGIRRDEDRVVASVLFSGLIREERNGRPEPFRELWHVSHPWGSREGDWHLAGIQQVTD